LPPAAHGGPGGDDKEDVFIKAEVDHPRDAEVVPPERGIRGRGGREGPAGTHMGGEDPGEGAQRDQSPGSVHFREEGSMRKDGQFNSFENNM